MRSLRSLSSQKKGTIYSLVLLVAVLALVIGILSASSAKFSTTPAQQFTPRWVQASAPNASLNITITNDATSPAAIKRVDITKPSGVGNIECGANIPTVPSLWTCARGSGDVFVKFTNSDGLAAGSSANFSINITPPAGAGNQTFTIDTFENTGGTLNINSTNINVSVDANPPSIRVVNISTSLTNSAGVAFGKNISADANFDSLVHIFLPNASGITIVVEALDNGSEVGNVTLVYNYTYHINQVPSQVPGRDIAGNVTVNMTNQSFGSSSLFGYTIPTGTLVNGSKVFFSILANDTVGNFNISNKTSTVGWNFTIDSAAPIFVDVQIINFSQLTTNTLGNAINTTKTFGSTVEYILNSSLLLNVSALVRDDGGSGVVRVQVMNRTGHFIDMVLTGGSNGSSTQTNWTNISMNMSELGQRVGGFVGDGLYNLSFRTTDNVSNVLNSNFTVAVDDTPPTGSVSSNLTIEFSKLSEGNVTSSLSSNTTFVLRLQTSNNIDNTTRNVSVFGNKGLIHNLTFESGTPSGTSFWNITIGNVSSAGPSIPNTTFALSSFCDLSGNDGSQCNFRFNFSDVLGRYNDTINLTVAVDTVAPNVSIVRPFSVTTNYSTTVLINASVNDSVGPLRNVSFRWTNSTAPNDYLEGANVSNWMPLTLSSGGNSQFSAQGYWTASLTISSLVDGNYSIEINATDSAGRQNTTTNITNIVFDSSRPTNITVVTPAVNFFSNANFTVKVNVTETISGLLNVSFRLENSTMNFSWVEATGGIVTLGTQKNYSASRFNITSWDNVNLNASNGGFSIRFNITDTAGNQNTSITVNFTIDTVFPGVSFINPLNNLNQSTNFTVNVTVTESNVGTVWYRWQNDSSQLAVLSGRGELVSMNNVGGANNWNASFGNLTDGTAFLDGNYSIYVNATDKAGNQNTSVFVQLILDKSAPVIIATGSNQTGSLDKTNHTGNFVVNLTINDTYSWNMNLGKIGTTNINGSAFRLENTTFNSSWFSLPFNTFDMTSADSNRTNATFTFSSVPNGLYNIRFMVNDTAGNQNNTVRVNNIMLDNIAPGVSLAATNVSPAPSGGAGLSGTLTFNASITDNLPVNISFANNITTQGNKFGVFYRFESASVTTAWLPMSTDSFQVQSLAQPHRVVFNASNITTTLTDGDYKLRINATDSAGNQNTTVTVDITIQNSQTNPKANITMTGIGIAGSSLNNPIANATPQLLMNTSENSTCKYSLNTQVDYYDGLTSTMSNNVSRSHFANLGAQRDGSYTLYYSCRDVSSKNAPRSDNTTSTFTFNVDTRNLYNVTIPGKTDSNWPNYFQAAPAGSANGWVKFGLSTLATGDSSLGLVGTQGGANVTNVLSSLMSGTTAGNFTRAYAHNVSTNAWTVFVVGQTGNNFVNFTGQDEFWINITAVDRIEIS